MHPATGLPLARVVPRGGTTLCGKFIPQNVSLFLQARITYEIEKEPLQTIVGANAWVMNYSKSVYGLDADVYRPERWFGDPVLVAAMDRTFSTVSLAETFCLIILTVSKFGHGSRTCIGKNISIMEISRLVPELLRRYNFSLAKPTEELKTRNTWFVKQSNLRCYISERV